MLKLAEEFNWSLPSNIHSKILHALLIESSHWAPNVNNQLRAKVLRHLVSLIPKAPRQGDLRPRLGCLLAVLTLGLNRGATRLRLPPPVE